MAVGFERDQRSHLPVTSEPPPGGIMISAPSMVFESHDHRRLPQAPKNSLVAKTLRSPQRVHQTEILSEPFPILWRKRSRRKPIREKDRNEAPWSRFDGAPSVSPERE
jgi:hypothetical protein